MLRSAEGYVSGQQLCNQLKVSRTAVWKVIEQLKAEGYDIEAVHGKGYHLVSVPDVISQAEIECRLQTKWAGCSVFYCPVIDSTNVKAKRLADEGAPHGTLVVAGHQSAGKGRRGRVWESPDLYDTASETGHQAGTGADAYGIDGAECGRCHTDGDRDHAGNQVAE